MGIVVRYRQIWRNSPLELGYDSGIRSSWTDPQCPDVVTDTHRPPPRTWKPALQMPSFGIQPLSFFSSETQFYFLIILILKQTRDAVKHTEVLDHPCQRVDVEGASAGHVQKQSVVPRSPVRQIHSPYVILYFKQQKITRRFKKFFFYYLTKSLLTVGISIQKVFPVFHADTDSFERVNDRHHAQTVFC